MNKFTHNIDFGFEGEALIIRTYNKEHNLASSFIPAPGVTVEHLIIQIKVIEKIMSAKIEKDIQNDVL